MNGQTNLILYLYHVVSSKTLHPTFTVRYVLNIPLQDREDGGDKLPVRAQAAAVQAPRPRPHQGDHAQGQLQGTLSGEIQHCTVNF